MTLAGRYSELGAAGAAEAAGAELAGIEAAGWAGEEAKFRTGARPSLEMRDTPGSWLYWF